MAGSKRSSSFIKHKLKILQNNTLDWKNKQEQSKYPMRTDNELNKTQGVYIAN